MSDKLRITGVEGKKQWAAQVKGLWEQESGNRRKHSGGRIFLLIFFNNCLFPSGIGGTRSGGLRGNKSKEASVFLCTLAERVKNHRQCGYRIGGQAFQSDGPEFKPQLQHKWSRASLGVLSPLWACFFLSPKWGVRGFFFSHKDKAVLLLTEHTP